VVTSTVNRDSWSVVWGIAPLLFIGVSQLVYMAPTIAYQFMHGRSETGKGLTILASVTFLLNAASFGGIALLVRNVGPRYYTGQAPSTTNLRVRIGPSRMLSDHHDFCAHRPPPLPLNALHG
jgi:hypothetical protein